MSETENRVQREKRTLLVVDTDGERVTVSGWPRGVAELASVELLKGAVDLSGMLREAVLMAVDCALDAMDDAGRSLLFYEGQHVRHEHWPHVTFTVHQVLTQPVTGRYGWFAKIDNDEAPWGAPAVPLKFLRPLE